MGNTCPLCNIEHEHSHFSYEIRKYMETENNQYEAIKSNYNNYVKRCNILQRKIDVMIARVTNWYIEFYPYMIDDLLKEIKEIK